MSQGGELVAKSILDYLTQDLNINLPVIDWDDPIWQLPWDSNDAFFKAITPIQNADLTNGCGEGLFDDLMRGYKHHLQEEYKANRITGSDYAKAYVALTESAMQNASNFLLQRDQSFWQAQLAQMQAFVAMVSTQTAKAEYNKTLLEAETAGAAYALTTMKLSTEDQAFGTASYNLTNILPAQYKLVQEQVEVQRAQTLDNRADGSPVSGAVGKQKELYSQQIVSYKRDAEVKASRAFTDSWIAQKTIDEGLEPPDGFTNSSIDKVLNKLMQENGFV